MTFLAYVVSIIDSELTEHCTQGYCRTWLVLVDKYVHLFHKKITYHIFPSYVVTEAPPLSIKLHSTL